MSVKKYTKKIQTKKFRINLQGRSLEQTVTEKEEAIRFLNERLNKDSSNNSKPPSTDGYKKKTKRKITNRSLSKILAGKLVDSQ
jgi:hypothetical protein